VHLYLGSNALVLCKAQRHPFINFAIRLTICEILTSTMTEDGLNNPGGKP